jgi:Sec-independent protein secretion pathway component TatC
MCRLYEVGIFCARMVERNRPKEDDAASQSGAA